MELNAKSIFDSVVCPLQSAYETETSTTRSLFVNANSLQPFQILLENVQDHCEQRVKQRNAERLLPFNDQDMVLLNIDDRQPVIIIGKDCKVVDQIENEEFVKSNLKILNGKNFGDIPASYVVPTLPSHEYQVIGVCIDERIVPGFKYKVRRIDSLTNKSSSIFDGNELELESIGRGYSRRITFAHNKGAINDNMNYFWSDSSLFGFAFELVVISVGYEFALLNSNSDPVARVRIVKLKAPQQEVKQTLHDDKSVEKLVRFSVLTQIEWYFKDKTSVTMMCGTAICIKQPLKSAKVTRVVEVTLDGDHRKYELSAEVDDKKRRLRVCDFNQNDVPTTYTISGLEMYELPVIGTYSDPKIMVGFYYKIRRIQEKPDYLFDGNEMRLVSIGSGLNKRFTFCNDFDQNVVFFETDSWAKGFAFELKAIKSGRNFSIKCNDKFIGHAYVLVADQPQYENKGRTDKFGLAVVRKFVQVNMTCCITILSVDRKILIAEIEFSGHRNIPVSGTAVLEKCRNRNESVVLKIEDVKFDQEYNEIYNIHHSDRLVFYPV